MSKLELYAGAFYLDVDGRAHGPMIETPLELTNDVQQFYTRTRSTLEISNSRWKANGEHVSGDGTFRLVKEFMPAVVGDREFGVPTDAFGYVLEALHQIPAMVDGPLIDDMDNEIVAFSFEQFHHFCDFMGLLEKKKTLPERLSADIAEMVKEEGKESGAAAILIGNRADVELFTKEATALVERLQATAPKAPPFPYSLGRRREVPDFMKFMEDVLSGKERTIDTRRTGTVEVEGESADFLKFVEDVLKEDPKTMAETPDQLKDIVARIGATFGLQPYQGGKVEFKEPPKIDDAAAFQKELLEDLKKSIGIPYKLMAADYAAAEAAQAAANVAEATEECDCPVCQQERQMERIQRAAKARLALPMPLRLLMDRIFMKGILSGELDDSMTGPALQEYIIVEISKALSIPEAELRKAIEKNKN